MTEHNIEIETRLLFQGNNSNVDGCLTCLKDALLSRKGITHVHLEENGSNPLMCIHYNPNLVNLSAVQRMAIKAGTSISDRYKHDQIPFDGMDRADEAPILRRELEQIPGMLHAEVNYAAGLAYVAYDSDALKLETITETLTGMGIIPLESPQSITGSVNETDINTYREFYPQWVLEKWSLIMVGLTGMFLLIGWAGGAVFGINENITLVFLIMAYLTGGYDIATHAIPGIFRGHFDTDVLMLAAAAGAAILGEWTEGAFLLFLFSLGHAGEQYALDRARNAVNALGEMMPKTAQLKSGDTVIERPVHSLLIGDRVVIRPGDRIPVDGEVVQGASDVDQSPITGESVPLHKGMGDEVFAGTINQTAALEINVTRLAKDNTLNRIMQMVSEAQSQRSPTQQFTERFTAWFVPAVLIFVLLVVVVPPISGWMSLQESFYRGMLLLVAASPCALALGTPAAVLAGIAQAARNGILIKGGVHLENLGALKVMAFDKTGTLTEGKFLVTDIIPLNGSDADELLRVSAAVEQNSNHPLALAIVRAARKQALTLPTTNGLENINGRGVKSEIEGHEVLIGSLKLFRELTGQPLDDGLLRTVESLEDAGKTTIIVRYAEVFLGVVALADAPRPGIKETLHDLSSMGIQKLVMLTGDNEEVAQRVGMELGVTDVRADLLPEQKLAAIGELKAEFGSIAMTGDGVNDAPALATATVGIAMGGAGTAVALETADVALMADDLSKLPFAVDLSRASRSIIRQNLAMSMGVIALLLFTSLTGWVQLSGAVLLHEGSSILVVLNALRLLNFKHK